MADSFPLPELTSAEADWQRDVLGCARDIPLNVGAGLVSVTFRSVPAMDEGPTIRFRAGTDSFWIRLANWNVLAGLADWLEGVDLRRLPKDVLAATFEVLLEDHLDRLSNLVGGPCETMGATDLAETINGQVTIGFAATTSKGEQSLGSLTTNRSGVDLVRSLIAEIPPREQEVVNTLPLVAGVQIGATSLSLDAVADLKPQDIVLIETSSFAEERIGLVRFADNSVWRVSVEEESVVLRELRESPVPSPAAGNAVTVLIVFEFGQVQVPAGEVAALTAEQQLTLQHAETVVLRVNGQPVGRGELVQIGPRMAIRLTEWRSPEVDAAAP